MNLLYEDLDNRNLDNHTRQIANPNITFDQYIANIKREMGEESDNPNPNPTPTPSRGEGKEGVGRDPNPNPNPNPNTSSNPNPNPNPSPTPRWRSACTPCSP